MKRNTRASRRKGKKAPAPRTRVAPSEGVDSLLLDNPVLHAWRLSYVANRYVFPFYRDLEQDHGVGRAEWVILFCLAQTGELIAQAIADKTGLPKNSISRAVGRLLERGFVKRSADRDDRRRVHLSLTPAGRRLHDAVVPTMIERERNMLAALSTKERATFTRLLLRIASRAADWA